MLVFDRVSKELIGIALIAIFLFIIFCRFYKSSKFAQKYAKRMVECEYGVLSIIFEAIPFILLGVIVSSLIQVFVTEDMIQKYCRNLPLLQ